MLKNIFSYLSRMAGNQNHSAHKTATGGLRKYYGGHVKLNIEVPPAVESEFRELKLTPMAK